MAISSRELLLIVRAQNQASAALRRVAGDVRAMGKLSGLQARRNQLMLNELNMKRQLARIEAEADSIRRGTRAMRLEQQRQRLLDRRAQTLRAIETAEAARAIQQQRLSRLVQRGANKDLLGYKQAQLALKRVNNQLADYHARLQRIGPALDVVNARHFEHARRLGVLSQEYAIVNQRIAQNALALAATAEAMYAERWERFGRTLRMVGHAGRVVQMGGLVAGAAVAYAASAAAKFETKAQLVGTQMGKLGISFRESTKLGSKFADMALKVLPQSITSLEDLTDAGYDLFSSLDSVGKKFLTVADGAKLLKLSSDMAIAGQTDIATSADATITIMNNYGDTADTVRKKINTMFTAVRFGRMTFGEFAKTMATTVPAAKQSGQTFDTMAASMALITRKIPSVERSAIGLARLMEMLTRKKMVEGLEKAGVTLTNEKGFFVQLPVMIDRIVKKFPELRRSGTKELATFFKTMSGQEGVIQARRAFQALVTSSNEYLDILKRVTSGSSEFDKALSALNQTAGVRWQKTLNRLRALAIELGRAAIPALEGMVRPIEKLVIWFQKLDDETKASIGRWFVWGSAIALVGGSILAVVGAIGGFISLLGANRVLFITLTPAVLAAVAAFKALAGEWRSLGDVAQGVSNMITGSWKSVLITAAIVTVAVLKLRSAIISLSLTTAAAGGLAGVGGLIGSLARLANYLRAYIPLVLTAGKGTGFLGRMIAMTKAAVVLLPGPLKLAAAAFAVVTGGLALWKLRADASRRATTELKEEIYQFNNALKQASIQAQIAQGIGRSYENLKEAKANLGLINIELQRLNKTIKTTSGTERQAAIYQRDLLLTQRAKLLRDVNTAQNAVYLSTRKYAEALANLREMSKLQRLEEAQLARWQRERSRIGRRIAQQQRMLLGQIPGKQGDPQLLGKLRDQYTKLGARIDDARLRLDLINASIQRGTQLSRQAITKMVANLQQIGEVSKKLSPKQIAEIAKVFEKLGRAPSLKDIKILAKAELDPRSTKNLPVKVHRALKAVRAEVKAELKVDIQKNKKQAKDIFGRISDSLTAPVKAIIDALEAKKAKATLEAQFSVAIKQPIEPTIPDAGELFALGQSISDGIANGIGTIHQSVVVNFYKNLITTYKKQGEMKSPSKLTARLVGKPIMQGIEMGMQDELPKLLDFARYSITVLAGTFLQAREEEISDRMSLEQTLTNKLKDINKKRQQITRQEAKIDRQIAKKRDIDELKATNEKYKQELSLLLKQKAALKRQISKIRDITAADLATDMKRAFSQLKAFDRALDTIAKRGAPMALVDQLRELGVEGLKYIGMLANAGQKEFSKFVRYWKKSMKLIKEDARAAFQAAVKEAKKANWKRIGQELSDRIDQAAQTLLDTWNNFRSTLQSGFGGLFQGPTNLAEKITDSLEEAADAFNEKMNDLVTELGDLQLELAQLGREAFEAAKDAFGPLFSGDWLSGDEVAFKREWGIALGMQDLIEDLNSQLTKFQSWRANLRSLAAKVPTDLLQELEKLGPEAADKIAILANATDGELQTYVALWRQSRNEIAGYGQDLMRTNQDFVNRQMDLLRQISQIQKQIADHMANPPSASPLTAADIIKDAQQQAAQFQEFAGILEELKKRNVPAQLILQLAELGPDGLPYLRALQSMTDRELKTWVNIWKNAQANINNATNFLMDTQLQLWRQHGNNIAGAIIAGVMDQQSTLLNFFRNMFINLLQGKPVNTSGAPVLTSGGSTSTPTSPSQYINTKPADAPTSPFTGPRRFAKGGIVWRPTKALVGERGPEAIIPLKYRPGNKIAFGNGKDQQPIHIEVNALQTEDLETTLRRAIFRLSSRRI